MRPVRVTVGPLAGANASNIATSQTPVSGTALTINGSLAANGVATLDTPRRILLTYGNEASNRTLVLTGTTFGGAIVSETLAVPSGASGTVASVLDYATLTSAVPAGGGWTAAVTLGTNGIAGSPWVFFDAWAPAPTMIQATASGTVNYTVQETQDDPNSIAYPLAVSAVTWVSSSDSGVVNASNTALSTFTAPPAYARVLLNSGSGSVTATFTQYGVNPI